MDLTVTKDELQCITTNMLWQLKSIWLAITNYNVQEEQQDEYNNSAIYFLEFHNNAIQEIKNSISTETNNNKNTEAVYVHIFKTISLHYFPPAPHKKNTF